MSILNAASLKTAIYPEIIDEICRTDETIVLSAIAAASGEAKLHLSRYQTDQLLGTQPETPDIDDPLLLQIVKQIAAWRIVQLAAVTVDYDKYRTAYQDALATLQQINTGTLVPDGWPYAAPSAPPDGDSIYWASNYKRDNGY
jgi:hypothetical protein